MHKVDRGRRGFTLIELLVVVAIIGALVAILIPGLGSARAAAYKVKCQTNMRTLAYLDAQYAGENNGFVARDSGTILHSVFYLLATMQNIKLTITPGGSGAYESEYA